MYSSGLFGHGRIAIDLTLEPGIVLPRCDTAPAIDGKLGDACWKNIKAIPFQNTPFSMLGANVDFLDALNFAGTNAGTVPPEYTTVSEALTDLDANGVINRQDFIGLDDLSEFRFFSNSFDTTTQGIDIVGTFAFALGSGESDLTIAFNFNETKVDSVGTVNPIDADRVAALEDLLPNTKGVISWRHSFGKFNTLLRGNYYGEWDDTGNGVPGISAAFLVDAAVTYMVNDNFDLIVGIDNLFDEYPDANPFAGDLGQLYSEASPFGFNGGTWYVRARAMF
jgi:iron complex outermembrane receptor protein